MSSNTRGGTRARRWALGLALSLAAGAAVADQLILDDLVVQGRECVGQDCVNGEAFADDTLRLKENNLRIEFQDSSGSALVPGNDWRITANDSRNGGLSRFSIDDMDATPTPFGEADDVTADADETLAIALGYLNGDGALDLVAANDGQSNRLYLGGTGTNPFAASTGTDITLDAQATTSIALGDTNGDFHLDVVAGSHGEPNRLYLNNGTADPFAGAVGSDITADLHATVAIAVADLNGDFRPDVVAGNDGEPNRLYLNNGTATPFSGVLGSDVTADAHATTSIALSDVDGDLDLDLVVGNFDQTNRLYLNNGTANPFVGVGGSDISADADATAAVALRDVDGDTDLDLVVGNSSQTNRLYLNNGTADPFAGVLGSDVGAETDVTTAIALADVDGDSFVDVLAGNDGEPTRLYRNNGSPLPFLAVPAQDVTADARATSAVTLTSVHPTAGPRDARYLVAGNRSEPNRVYLPFDDDGGTSPLTIEAGAPDHSLYVDGQGQVGLGTDSPDPGASLHVLGDIRVDGDLVMTARAKRGVVPASAFAAGARTATVSFAEPYASAGEYVIILTPVMTKPGRAVSPVVTARDANGFTISRGGGLRNLGGIAWTTRLVGEQ